ncbi:MAG: hypothetical protein RLZZ301_1043 [Bacteroidota bacterium]|jgi:ADP-heptose:LPS heptosyltransferase
MKTPKQILISRTDSIGDVCLTLPLCVALKKQFPSANLVYLCKSYTQAVVACFEPIDEIMTLETLMQLTPETRRANLARFDAVIHVFPNQTIANWCHDAKIPIRIGTSHRLFHWWTCTHRPRFSRKNSELHEAQLNFFLLKPLGVDAIPSRSDLNQPQAFHIPVASNPAGQQLANAIILHPKSQGSGLEYPLANYMQLALLLAERGYQIYFSGTEKEGALFRDQIPQHPNIQDATGQWSLTEFIAIIGQVKALVACSTGPYHVAGLAATRAIGLFSSRRPIHPGRWSAIGPKALALVHDPLCSECLKGAPCKCIEHISIESIADVIEK